jgi:hypothetical protein
MLAYSLRRRLVLALLMLLSVQAFASATYAPDMTDVWWVYADAFISPIGDLGTIRTIVDLRGFIPLSLLQKSRACLDCLNWYKFPLKDGVARVYYGGADPSVLSKLAATKIVGEDHLSREQLGWAKLAYGLVKSSSADLFVAAGGYADDLDTAEPVAVLMTDRSALIIVNFKYSDFERRGTGQIMCCYEFSRSLREYKTFYRVSSTLALNRSTRTAFAKSMPYVLKALAAYVGQ